MALGTTHRELSFGRELITSLGANPALGVEKPGCKGVWGLVNPPHGPKTKGCEAIFEIASIEMF